MRKILRQLVRWGLYGAFIIMVSYTVKLAIKGDDPGVTEMRLEACLIENRAMVLEREIVFEGAALASYLADIAHKHALVCARAYRACGLEEYEHEWAGGEKDKETGLRGADRDLPGGRGASPHEPVRDH